mmetsp:Transcript_25147/g.65608  ORF Transcript_25147/g.65608 Transcript_25147/m.65608 type:complete len:229 (-) Transcript_25147:108-794(-)
MAASQKKAYAMAFVKITDPAKFKEYVALVQPSMDPYGGKFLFKKPTIPGTPMGEVAPLLERDTAKDYTVAVVVEFPSLEKALAWNSGPEYTKARVVRKASSTGPFMVTESLDETGFSFNALMMLAVKVNDGPKFAGEYIPGFIKSLNQDGEQLGMLVARGLVNDHPKMGPAAPFVEDADMYTLAVIVAFKDEAAMKNWDRSDAYKPYLALRHEITEGPALGGATMKQG